MKSYTVSKDITNSQASVGQSVQRKATATLVDNRPTAVRQRVIQQAALSRPNLVMQPMVSSHNLPITSTNNQLIMQRKVIDGGQRHSGSKIFQLHQDVFEREGFSEDDLVDFVNGNDDMTLAELYAKLKINSAKKRDKADKEDGTFKGKRMIGDSNRLAKNRYSLKVKTRSFKPWKKDREAQHIIPATVAKMYPILESIIDEAENGIMLPATYQAGNKKLTHRMPKYRDHPTYTKNVKNLIKQVLKKTKLKNNQATMRLIMRSLRPVNKLTKYKYIDRIPVSEYTQSWNNMNAAYKI